MSDFPARQYVPLEAPRMSPDVASSEVGRIFANLYVQIDHNLAAIFDRVQAIMRKLNISEAAMRRRLETLPDMVRHTAEDSAKLLVSDLELRLMRDSLAKRFQVWMAVISAALLLLPEIARIVFTHHW